MVGIILVVGLIAVIVWAVMYDKKRAGQFDAQTDKLFEGKKAYGNESIFITIDNELVIRYHSAGVSGYKIYKPTEVKYVMSCWNPVDKIWNIGLYNEKKKLVVGEDHKSTKKNPLKAKAYFQGNSENVEFVEMLLKFAPEAQLVGMSFKEYKGSVKQ